VAVIFSPLWRSDPIPGHDFPLRGFAITHTGHPTVGRTYLDEWSVSRRDFYLTTHGIRTQNPSTRATADPRLRRRRHRDRQASV